MVSSAHHFYIYHFHDRTRQDTSECGEFMMVNLKCLTSKYQIIDMPTSILLTSIDIFNYI